MFQRVATTHEVERPIRERQTTDVRQHQLKITVTIAMRGHIAAGQGQFRPRSGHLLEQMSRTRPELALTGSDVAAHGNSNRNFELVLSDVGRLPFADRAFDFVSCCHTLEHIIELPAALAELRRVTRRRLLTAALA